MGLKTDISFEQLLQSQVRLMTNCKPAEFEACLEPLALQALEWFDLDRCTLFPNSMLSIEEDHNLSFNRNGIAKLVIEEFTQGDAIRNVHDYLKLLRADVPYQVFTERHLANSDIVALKTLHQQGARWHCIIRLQLFGQVWGALAFARFNRPGSPPSESQLLRLKLLCDAWLVYWQHASVAKALNHGQEKLNDEQQKLQKLSKKQRAVLSLLAQGLSAKQCAERLFLSPRTIESHKYRMLTMLDFDSHSELIQFALRNGLGFSQPQDKAV
ncbi:helix-turn-helix transcriptional regulator [Ferrimonas aestuarii]|uniref:Response regulator transcription factor n=1 Tax=Ferrimonas aestuarii TaxID=2569539 RepID=A0A4V5NVD8_9GAMM|nr:LuxR C-terminal-related transcriptional regulator [Ferrimonas aestuarii]TKB50061.1 response regulator transcription factor [Ferrimonas aestuarii]